MWLVSWNLGASTSCYPQGLSRPLMVLLYFIIYIFFPVALRPNAGHDLLILEVSRSHTTMHHSRKDSSGRVISPSQRLLPDNTQHSQQTDIHRTPLDEWSARRTDLYLTTHNTHNRQTCFRTRNRSKQAVAAPRIRPRSQWDAMTQNINWIRTSCNTSHSILTSILISSTLRRMHSLVLSISETKIHPHEIRTDVRTGYAIIRH